MTTDDLRALLDAAAKATPVAWLFQHDETGRTGFIEDHMADDFFRMNPRLHRIRPVYDHAAASPDVVASLARIALAAAEHERVRSTVVAERARNAGEYDAAINAMLQSRADLVAAIADAGLLTTAPQETQP